VEKKFGFFYQPDYNYIRRKKTEEKKAAAYKWSALADEGGPAAAPWIYNLYIPARLKAESNRSLPLCLP